MSLRKDTPFNNKSLDDQWSAHGVETVKTSIHSKSLIKTSVPVRSSSGGIQLQNRIIHTVTPDGKDRVRSLLPKIDGGFGNLAVSTSSSAGSSSIVTSSPVQHQLQKPITIMAKDPKTGLVRPVTLLPKPTVNHPRPMAIRLAAPVVTKPIIQNAVRMPVIVHRQTLIQPKPGQNSEHGLICKDGCKCAIMTGTGEIEEKLKQKLFMYLKKCTKITRNDSELFLTYSWIQDEIFSLFLSNLQRHSFFKLARVVSFKSSMERKKCILIKKQTRNLVDGMVFIKGENYPMPSILLKLFRDGYDNIPLNSLIIESSQDCEMTK